MNLYVVDGRPMAAFFVTLAIVAGVDYGMQSLNVWKHGWPTEKLKDAEIKALRERLNFLECGHDIGIPTSEPKSVDGDVDDQQ